MEAVCCVCATPLHEDSSVPACQTCLARLRQILDQLPAIYVQLHTELPRWATRNPSGTPTKHLAWKYRPSPIPVRMPLLAHAEHTVHTVHTWAHQALPRCLPDAPVRPGHLLQYLCRLLAQDLPASLQPPVQPHHPQATWDAYQYALRLLHQDDAPERLTTPCPTCDLRSLYRDRTGMSCHSCHSRFPH
ncbi:hypothetical protein [Streptomyces luteireticuli]|uniref:hypothetical protein n=1 Tax=Streptomyces luteireticuli TaxID=173858 RepID=UPI0035581F59